MELWTAKNMDTMTGDVVVFNTESLFHYYTDEMYRNFVNSVDTILIDGIGLKIALLMFGLKVKRYNGPDFLRDVLDNSMLPKYIYGGQIENYNASNGEVLVDLPFSQNVDFLSEQIKTHVEHYTNEKSLIILSLGLPKQEKVASLLRRKLKNRNIRILPVGAAVDYTYGIKVRSSVFWRVIGLEWLPRLIREPRMLKRLALSVLGLVYLISDVGLGKNS